MYWISTVVTSIFTLLTFIIKYFIQIGLVDKKIDLHLLRVLLNCIFRVKVYSTFKFTLGWAKKLPIKWNTNF